MILEVTPANASLAGNLPDGYITCPKFVKQENRFRFNFLLCIFTGHIDHLADAVFPTLDFEWHENFWKNNGTCVAERQLPNKDIVGIQTGQVDRYGNFLWEAERWFEEKRRWFDGYLSSSASSEPATRNVFDIYLGAGNLIFVKEPCGPEDTEHRFFVHLIPTAVNDLPDHRKQYGFDNLDFDFQWHDLREGGRCMAIRALPEYDIVKIRVGQYEGGNKFWTAEIPVP